MYIRFISLADGSAHEVSGQWLVSYDPDYHWTDGTYDGGDLRTTDDKTLAQIFSYSTAIEIIRSQPSCQCHRLRADGKPNRPLTAFTVCIEL